MRNTFLTSHIYLSFDPEWGFFHCYEKHYLFKLSDYIPFNVQPGLQGCGVNGVLWSPFIRFVSFRNTDKADLWNSLLLFLHHLDWLSYILAFHIYFGLLAFHRCCKTFLSFFFISCSISWFSENLLLLWRCYPFFFFFCGGFCFVLGWFFWVVWDAIWENEGGLLLPYVGFLFFLFWFVRVKSLHLFLVL